jgi:adenylosuccinate synthase
VGYELDGKTIDYFPSSVAALEKCQPIYEELPGWQTPISHIREYEQLPVKTRQYVAKLEELISCPANLICVGPERGQTILKTPIL